MFENKYIQQRIQKADILREAGFNPYCNISNRDTTIEKYNNVNSDIEHIENKRDENRIYTVAGRIKFLDLWEKLLFLR